MSEQTTPKGANIPRKRNALGRGLSALMSSAAVSVDFASRENAARSLEVVDGGLAEFRELATPANSASNAAPAPLQAAEPALEGGLMYLSIDRVFPNKEQPRQHFVPADIQTLADSIRSTGLLQPIVVRRRSSEVSGQLATYEIIAGERRFRAAKQAGLVKIPALLRQINDREALELGIVENVQRADLNPIEEALAYKRLSETFGASQAEIAEKVGKDRASVANALRLLKLVPEVQQMLIKGELSAGHGRALLGLDEASAQLGLAKRIIKDGLSVRATEQALKEGVLEITPRQKHAASASQETANANTAALEERFRRALGTKVKLILDEAGKGELKVSFFSAAELDRLLEKVGA